MVPEDVIIEILKRLPAKSLIRLKSVSKSWRSKIESPEFVKLHLTQSRNNNRNKIIVSIIDVPVITEDLEVESPRHTKLRPPGTRHNFVPRLLGCCDGLVAVSSSYHEIVIWNPYTREHRILSPTQKIPIITSSGLAYGLGHDSLSQDYKLIMMQPFPVFQIEVYSLKSNAWREMKRDIHYFPSGWPKPQGVQTNEALHWVACHKVSVFAFDLHNEEFREMELPDDWSKRNDDMKFLDVLDGQLFAARLIGRSGILEMWVMKEYGVKESWTLLNRLDFWHLSPIWPVFYSRRGERVLLLNWRSGNLEWFYPDKNNVEEVIGKLCLGYGGPAWILVESIVSLRIEGGC